MAIHFLNTTRETFLSEYKRVHRFTTIDRFLEGLTSKQMAFASPTKWSDPFEKFYLERDFKIHGERFQLSVRDKIFAVCLSGTTDSEAYWKVYSPKEDGIRLTFDTERLVTHFLEKISDSDVYIGKVNYQPTREFHKITVDRDRLADEITTGNIGEQQLHLLLKKRQSFFYKNEIRILVVPHKPPKKKSVYHGPTDITIYTENYTFDSRLGRNHVKVLRDYLLKEFEINASHSRLYSEIMRDPIVLTDSEVD